MIFYNLILLIYFFLFDISNIVAQSYSCASPSSKCPSGLYSCCSQTNWCGRGPLYCGPGCQEGKSDGCYTKPSCINKFFPLTQSNTSTDPDNDFVIPLQEVLNSTSGDKFTLDSGAIEMDGPDGLALTLIHTPSDINSQGRKIGSGTRISSMMYLQYGQVSAKIKVAKGSGVVTAFILMADEKDEIDFEILGRNVYEIQTNYFYNGILDYTRGVKSQVNVDLSSQFYNYTIRWTPQSITWLFEDQILRVLQNNGSLIGYPHHKSRIQLGIWDGASMAEGTREWAGDTDWDSTSIYKSYVQSVNVNCADLDQVQVKSGQKLAIFHPSTLLLIVILSYCFNV